MVLDGDSRDMENKLKVVAQGYGHQLQPLFLPGDTSPEQWLWEILHVRLNDYAAEFGLAVADMAAMTSRVANLVGGTVQQRDKAKAAVGAFADDIGRTVPEIARSVGRKEAENKTIPDFLTSLRDQINLWRRF